MNRKTFFFIFVLFGAALLHLFMSTGLIDKNYKISNLNQEVEKIKNENRHLKYAIAQKEDLAQIEKFARERLAMDEPKEVIYITFLSSTLETFEAKTLPLSPKLP